MIYDTKYNWQMKDLHCAKIVVMLLKAWLKKMNYEFTRTNSFHKLPDDAKKEFLEEIAHSASLLYLNGLIHKEQCEDIIECVWTVCVERGFNDVAPSDLAAFALSFGISMTKYDHI